jgi:lipoprotein NlpI
MQLLKSWVFVGVLGISAITASAQTPSAPAPAAPAPAAPAEGASAKDWVGYGTSNGARGDMNAAISAFDQAIKLDPKYAPAYFFRGRAYSFLNKQDDAVSNYDQAIQIDPTYTEAYYQRGSLKGEKGDFDAAISDFSQVIKLDPKYAPAYYNRGHVQYFKGDLANALDQLNQALAIDPTFPFSYFIRGLVHHAQGQRDEATADFQKSAGFNFPYAVYWVWITEMEAGQPMQARKDLSDALSRPECFKPDDWPSQIGNFLLEKITRDQLMTKTKSDNPTEATGRVCEAWFYVGEHSLQTGDPKEARECFTQAVATGAKGSEEYVEANRLLTTLAAH